MFNIFFGGTRQLLEYCENMESLLLPLYLGLVFVNNFCMLGKFHAFVGICHLFKKKKLFQEKHYHSVKRYGSRSGLTFCQSLVFAKVNHYQQMTKEMS